MREPRSSTFPKKVRGWIHFGTSDPAQTGEILGAVSILFAMYGQGVRVLPDFDQAVFEGKVELQTFSVNCLYFIEYPFD